MKNINWKEIKSFVIESFYLILFLISYTQIDINKLFEMSNIFFLCISIVCLNMFISTIKGNLLSKVMENAMKFKEEAMKNSKES